MQKQGDELWKIEIRRITNMRVIEFFTRHYNFNTKHGPAQKKTYTLNTNSKTRPGEYPASPIGKNLFNALSEHRYTLHRLYSLHMRLALSGFCHALKR